MNKYYFTFGQDHLHKVNGEIFDKDCIIEIEAENHNDAREKMFNNFGEKWAFEYNKLPDMSFFPRGIIKL